MRWAATSKYISPLRERREDIPLLALHFLGEEAPGIQTDAIDALFDATWPGNVRQLRNVVQSARAVAGEGKIAARHLALDSGPPGPADPLRSEIAPRTSRC